MPALDFTPWPSKPAAPPAVSAGAPRQTARTGAPKTGPKTGSKTGSANGADGEFGQLVDRLADAPDEGQASSRGAMTRGSRDSGVIGEESAAEPRAKGDADGASGTANDAPAVLASVASNPAPFPWTLPLSPSLWNFGQVQDDSASAGDTAESVDGDGVTSAIAGAIANGAAGACLATLPGAETGETSASTTFTVPVDAPIAVDAAGTIGAASTASAGAQGASDESEIDGAASTDAAAAAGSVLLEHKVAANVSWSRDDRLTNDSLASAALATANPAMASGQFANDESTIDPSAANVLATATLEPQTSITSNDSTLLAPSAMSSATMAAAVDDAAATTAAATTDAAQTGQANAAIDAPAPGDQAREQALIELQRALESARTNASSAATPQTRSADARIVIQTGTPGSAATDDAAATANAAAAFNVIANTGESSSASATPAAESGAEAITSASARTSRSRDARPASEDIDPDSALTASSWAAAAAAKYAEAMGAGTSSGSDTPDSGSNADAAASIALAGRAGGDAGSLAPIGFDARVLAASRANDVSASELPDGWAGESAIVTTAEPGEQAAQIVRSMRLQWRGANGEATLRLQPDHLGQVFVSVRVEQGTVSATVRAETPAAQQWIQQHQQQLRDALDAQGLRVAQFHVTSNPDDRPRRDHDQDQQDATGRRGSRARTRRADDDRRFEIHL